MNDYKPDIWRLQFQSDIDGLTEALSNADPDIRKRAAAALRTLGAISAIPTLKTVLENESDTDTRAHILAALDHLAAESPEVKEKPAADLLEQNRVSRLIADLNLQESPERIIEAAHELGELDDKLAGEPLVMVFNNANLPMQVRLTVAETLLKLECAPMEVSLLGALRNPDWHVRYKAAAVLGKIKADWAVPPLSEALYDDHKQVRRTAGAALRHINTPAAQTALRNYIRAWKTGAAVTRPKPPAKPAASKPKVPPKPAASQPPASPKSTSTSKTAAKKSTTSAQVVPEKQRTGLRARLDAAAAEAANPPDVDPNAPTVEVPRSEKKPAADPTAPTVEIAKPAADAPAEVKAPAESEAPDTPAADTVEAKPATEFQPPKQTARLSWPKRKPANTTLSIAPTAQLDPKTLEKAQERFQRLASSLEQEADKADKADAANDSPVDDKPDDQS